MASETGRFVTAYNGEIYNHQALRRELAAAGHAFRGSSDTETLLAALEEWGVAGALKRFNGMFAFAVWDAQKKELVLARDRVGIKPLYYGQVGQQVIFASELKALRRFSKFSPTIDRAALSLYLQHSYVPAPYTIYEGVRKLPPGTFLTIGSSSYDSLPRPQAYWTLDEVATRSADPQGSRTGSSVVDSLEELLRDSIRQRLVADVPVGAFLSGGIDSSAVVSLAQLESGRAIKTFSIGFEDPQYDESQYAAAIARHLKTDHTSLQVTAQDAQAIIPLLPTLYDEPFADSSQIPTFLVSRLARQEVTVALTGDGGDELFGGYDRYFLGERIWRSLGWIPRSVRQPLARFLMRLQRRVPIPQKLATIVRFLDSVSPGDFYSRFHGHWKNPEEIVRDGSVPMSLASAASAELVSRHFIEHLMYIDTKTYLPDDILVKVDRASMGVGLEARVPFLDHRVLEFAWSLPCHDRFRSDQPKWIVRSLVERHVPASLLDRPKVGFGVPLDTWLRGDLRDWAEALLDEQRLMSEGYFKPQAIREKWREHLSGTRDWHYYLWDVLMFQAWLEAA